MAPKELVLEESVAVALTPEHAFAGTLPIPLDAIFRRWYGPIPRVKKVIGQKGEWGAVGQTRTVVTADRGSMRETLTAVNAPASFSYQLANIKGPTAMLLASVAGEWRFTADGDGTRITWQWTIVPKSFAAPLMPLFAKLWHGYARTSLNELARLLSMTA